MWEWRYVDDEGRCRTLEEIKRNRVSYMVQVRAVEKAKAEAEAKAAELAKAANEARAAEKAKAKAKDEAEAKAADKVAENLTIATKDTESQNQMGNVKMAHSEADDVYSLFEAKPNPSPVA